MPQRHRSELSESVSADSLGSYRRTPRTFSPGRTCMVPGCLTVLSIYNSAKHCAAHNPKQIRLPRPRVAPTASAPVVVTAEASDRSGGRQRRVRSLVESSGAEVRQQAS